MALKTVLIAAMSTAALVNMGFCFRSLLYNKFLYGKMYRSKFDEAYTPKVAVFVPCKGLEENLQSYLEAIVCQDYPDYSVTFITESDSDPAVEAIRNVVAQYPHTSHVVSGRAEKCCQKNHNLLKAIDHDSDSEIFIFADADIRPNKRWIRDLVLPLSSEKIPISTGFRWLTPAEYSFNGTLHSMLSAYICTLMSSSSGVWGGSMAIRRKEFEKFGVYEKWATSVVDDISLTQIIIKNRIQRVFVPHCIAVSSNVLSSFGGNLEWFTRQLMFLKVYCRPLWLSALIMHVLIMSFMGLSLFLLGAGIFMPGFREMVLPAALFLTLMMLSYGLIKFNYNDSQSYILWVLLSVPGELIGFLSLVKSALQSDIIWRGIRYELNRDGSVKTVQFLQA